MTPWLVALAALLIAAVALMAAVGAAVRADEAYNLIKNWYDNRVEDELQQIIWEDDPDNAWRFYEDDGDDW